MLIHHPHVISDNEAIYEAIQKCDLIHVAFEDGDHPYILPLNFGVLKTQCGIEIFLHLTEHGKKTKLLDMNPTVGFEANWYKESEEKKFHCHLVYQSITGYGKIRILHEEEECVNALNALLLHYGRKPVKRYSAAMFEDLSMASLLVSGITGREISEY